MIRTTLSRYKVTVFGATNSFYGYTWLMPRIVLPVICLVFSCLGPSNASSFRFIQTKPNHNWCGITLPPDTLHAKGLIVWLHGGMQSHKTDKGKFAHRPLLQFADSNLYYFISPSAHRLESWVSSAGLRNISSCIESVLSSYPVNINDINLVGVSDGCLGVIAFSCQSKFAINRRVLISSFPQLILPIQRIGAIKILKTGSWHFFQGGKDRIFPIHRVKPYLDFWVKTIPNSHLYFFEKGEHDFSFYAVRAKNQLSKILQSSPGKTN